MSSFHFQVTSNIPSNVNFSESMDDPLWTAGVTAGGGSVACAAAFMDKYLPAKVCGRGGREAGDRVARLSGWWLSRAALLCGWHCPSEPGLSRWLGEALEGIVRALLPWTGNVVYEGSSCPFFKLKYSWPTLLYQCQLCSTVIWYFYYCCCTQLLQCYWVFSLCHTVYPHDTFIL